MTRHLYAQPHKMHTFTTQVCAMAVEGRKAVRVHDPMERYVRLVAVP